MAMSAPMPEPVVHRPLRILYAEDLRAMREMLQMTLTQDGHLIECVPDGRAAWERLVVDHATFDLVITDHHMPEMEGLELVRRLRALPYRGKIIVFSSELRPAVADAYFALKVDAVLPKPIPPPLLRRVLADLYGSPGGSSSAGSVSVPPPATGGE